METTKNAVVASINAEMIPRSLDKLSAYIFANVVRAGRDHIKFEDCEMFLSSSPSQFLCYFRNEVLMKECGAKLAVSLSKIDASNPKLAWCIMMAVTTPITHGTHRCSKAGSRDLTDSQIHYETSIHRC
jgi:hypothetical protein